MAVKAVSPEKFSLVTFGIAQVLVDLQPLAVSFGVGDTLHGWTHTFAGSIGLGLAAAVLGKYLTPVILKLLSFGRYKGNVMPWRVAFSSGLIGSISHVLLDALVYPDMSPFWPVVKGNPMTGGSNTGMLVFCVLSGIAGLLVYIIRRGILRKNTHQENSSSN